MKEKPAIDPRALMAGIRNHCDKRGLKGKLRAQYIREFKRLALEKHGIKL